jgi:gas vesicle protein
MITFFIGVFIGVVLGLGLAALLGATHKGERDW